MCSGFNEAAGNTPRKTAVVRLHDTGSGQHASMRPRGIPRGKPAVLRWIGVALDASMRPRGIPRGKRDEGITTAVEHDGLQ